MHITALAHAVTRGSKGEPRFLPRCRSVLRLMTLLLALASAPCLPVMGARDWNYSAVGQNPPASALPRAGVP